MLDSRDSRCAWRLQQLHELHRRQDEIEATAEVERARVGDDGVEPDAARLPRARRSSATSSGSESSAVT